MIRFNPILWLGCLCLLLGFSAHGATTGKLYRWVDENGQVFYSDQVPANHADSARSELNTQGIEVGHTDAAMTAEELAKQQELERMREEQQRIIEEQRFKDRVLLRTFRTEQDLLLARDNKLTAIDAMIQVTRSNIRRMKDKLSEMQQSAAALERQGRPLSENLIKDIENTRQQLKTSYITIVRREQEKESIRLKATNDLARFRALKHMKPREEESLPEAHRTGLLDTLVICTGAAECDEAWSRVETYVRKHSTTRMQMLSDAIIMTAAPAKDQDITLTVTRIPREGEQGAELFLDLQCKPSPLGIDFCKGDLAEKIRTGFRPFLEEKRLF